VARDDDGERTAGTRPGDAEPTAYAADDAESAPSTGARAGDAEPTAYAADARAGDAESAPSTGARAGDPEPTAYAAAPGEVLGKALRGATRNATTKHATASATRTTGCGRGGTRRRYVRGGPAPVDARDLLLVLRYFVSVSAR
jgi:hypothetical protein